MYFDELDLNDDILDGLDAMNFSECTPIQEKAIPVVLEGNDILASAQTGTGKTAAYLLPLLELLSRGNQQKNKVNALILVPTRELALQVDQLLGGFAYYTDISWIAVYGGNDGIAFSQQEKALKSGGDIAIATPGRLLSHLRTNNVDFSCIEYLILDEADRMLDIGFYDDIMEIISYLPQKRQTLMFSATFPSDVESLAKKILSNPVEVKIAVSKPAEGIEQGIYLLNESQKNPLLKDIFKDGVGKSIIFSSSKEKVWEIYLKFKQQGVNIEQMHSGLLQEKRKEVMLNFKNNKLQAIVATDIVSRGIDIDDVELVVNYDVPKQPEDYVHRIGRTARAGAKGRAITFVSPKDRHFFDRIEKFLEKPIKRLTLPEKIAEMAPVVEDKPAIQRKKKFYSPKGKNWRKSNTQKQKAKSNL
ncbi:MAG: DEAD/DEAH box helicase [Paludibacteraceae bacterium]|nr:DEAD/DEAH box helicase [Paludibacteraceae bacterium]